MALPALSPLLAPEMFCDRCGEKLNRKIVKDPAGRAIHMLYSCTNKDAGCNYELISDERAHGMQRPIKDVKIKEIEVKVIEVKSK
jgi:hypothetical protein